MGVHNPRTWLGVLQPSDAYFNFTPETTPCRWCGQPLVTGLSHLAQYPAHDYEVTFDPERVGVADGMEAGEPITIEGVFEPPPPPLAVGQSIEFDILGHGGTADVLAVEPSSDGVGWTATLRPRSRP
jgi:hypothetical protein